MILLVRVLCGCGAALWLQVRHVGQGDRVRYLSDAERRAVTHCPACGALLGLDVVERPGAVDD